MNDLRKAAEMALEFMSWLTSDDHSIRPHKAPDIIEALRQALDDKPPVKTYAGGKPNYCTPEETLKTPLKVLNLTVFTENRLRNGRVYDVETLQAMTNRDILAIPDMGKKALAEVLEALNAHAVNISQDRVDETAKGEHDLWIAAACLKSTVEAAIKAGDWKVDGACDPTMDLQYLANCFSSIQNREWVGLTDEEIGTLTVFDGLHHIETPLLADFIRATEAKLKEKNGG